MVDGAVRGAKAEVVVVYGISNFYTGSGKVVAVGEGRIFRQPSLARRAVFGVVGFELLGLEEVVVAGPDPVLGAGVVVGAALVGAEGYPVFPVRPLLAQLDGGVVVLGFDLGVGDIVVGVVEPVVVAALEEVPFVEETGPELGRFAVPLPGAAVIPGAAFTVGEMERGPDLVPLAEPGGVPVPVVVGGLVFEVETVEVDPQGRGEEVVVEGQVGVGIEAVAVVPGVGVVAAVAQAAAEFEG
jgi:hypothetical protein